MAGATAFDFPPAFKEQLDKILSVRHKLPHLRHIVQYTGDVSGQDGVMSWSQLMELGRSQTDQVLDQRLSDIVVNQCASLCYTSGTTGNPKVIDRSDQLFCNFN